MDFKKILLALSVIIICSGISSCKKEEEEKVYKSFGGYIDFTLASFVEVGDVVTVTPTGITAEENDTYGYYWIVSPVMTAADTTKKYTDPETVTGAFTFQIPDTLCNLEFRCTAYNPGYYSVSATQKTAIIDKEKSLSGRDFSKATGTFTDKRDNKSYYYVRIGELDWFCSNLTYEGAGVPFRNSHLTSGLFGMFYNWDEAVQACPEGWRLPTEEDWVALAQSFEPDGSFKEEETFTGVTGHLLSNAIFNGEKDSLWEYWPKIKVTNEKSMNVLPFGYCYSDGSTFTFKGFGDYAAFWTGSSCGDDHAIYRYFNEGNPDILVSSADKKTFYATVRCVREAE